MGTTSPSFLSNMSSPTTVTMHGNPVPLAGSLPAVGEAAPDFTLVGADLSDLPLSSFEGSNVVLSIFPSVDTPTCATSVRRFNTEAASLDNTKVVCVSKGPSLCHGPLLRRRGHRE